MKVRILQKWTDHKGRIFSEGQTTNLVEGQFEPKFHEAIGAEKVQGETLEKEPTKKEKAK